MTTYKLIVETKKMIKKKKEKKKRKVKKVRPLEPNPTGHFIFL
jgi:hypothetical protein